MNDEMKSLVAQEIARQMMNGSGQANDKAPEPIPLRNDNAPSAADSGERETLEDYVKRLVGEAIGGRGEGESEQVEKPVASPLPPPNTKDPLSMEAIGRMSPEEINENWSEISKILATTSTANEHKADVHPPVQPSATDGGNG